MFIGNVFSLETFKIEEKGMRGGNHDLRAWPAWRKRDNLLVAKDHRGDNFVIPVPWSKDGHYLLLNYSQDIYGTTSSGSLVLVGSLAKRIIDYLQKYYGQRHTNCSTLAEYLRTENFIECNGKNNLMFSEGMTWYAGQKIRPGDSLCV